MLRTLTFLLVLLSVACDEPVVPEVLPWATLRVTVSQAPAPESLQLELSTAPAALGGTSGNAAVVASSDEVHEVVGARAQLRRLFALAGEPLSTGQPHAVGPRLDGGAWLGAEHGLYLLEGSYVSRSPLSDDGGAVTSVVEVEGAALGGLWFTRGGELRRRQASPARLEVVRVPGLSQVDAVAVARDGERAFVLGGGQLRLLRRGAQGLESLESPFDGGRVRAVAAGQGLLAALTEGGVLLAGADGGLAWTVLQGLGEDGDAPLALALDGTLDVLWVRRRDSVVRVQGAGAQVYPVGRADGAALLAVTALGDVLTSSEDGGVVRLLTGASRTDFRFAADVRPVVAAHCQRCHADYADPVAFAARAQEALRRLREGDMPRCAGNLRCPEPLPPQTIGIVDGWIRGGKAP